jgi:hypothetical protein
MSSGRTKVPKILSGHKNNYRGLADKHFGAPHQRLVNPPLNEGLPPFPAADVGMNSGLIMPQVTVPRWPAKAKCCLRVKHDRVFTGDFAIVADAIKFGILFAQRL